MPHYVDQVLGVATMLYENRRATLASPVITLSAWVANKVAMPFNDHPFKDVSSLSRSQHSTNPQISKRVSVTLKQGTVWGQKMPFILFKKGDRRKFQTKEWQTSPERQCCHCLEFHRSCLPGISTIYDNPSRVSPQTKLDVVQVFDISNILEKKTKTITMHL